MIFNPEDHYWIVAGDDARAWSSASRGYVDIDDDGYVTWVADGGAPTRIESEAQVFAVVNAPIIAEIRQREAEQARPMREIALGIVPADGEPTPQERLQVLDDAIAALRASLLS